MIKQKYIEYDLTDTTITHEEFAVVDISSLLNCNGEAPYTPHVHSFYQIIWFERGEGVHYVDFKEYPICDNTIFFLAPGQVHYFSDSQNIKGRAIHFNETILSDGCRSENTILKYNLFNAFDSVPFFHIKESDAERLSYIANQMQVEIERSGEFAHNEILRYLTRLFLIFVQRGGERGGGIPLCMNNVSNRTFIHFRELLENNYKRIHTVKEYADILNITAKTLTNYTALSSTYTPLALINERIILESKRLLRHSDLKIKEISYSLGFEDPSYFIKFFKRHAKCNPTDFREQGII